MAAAPGMPLDGYHLHFPHAPGSVDQHTPTRGDKEICVTYDAVAFWMRLWALWCRTAYGIEHGQPNPDFHPAEMLTVSMFCNPTLPPKAADPDRKAWSMPEPTPPPV